MSDRVIFSSLSELVNSQLYPDAFTLLGKPPCKLKLNVSYFTTIQFENWLYEMAFRGIDIEHIQMQLVPKSNNSPTVGQKKLLKSFESAKRHVINEKNKVLKPKSQFSDNWKILLQVKFRFLEMNESFDILSALEDVGFWKKNLSFLDAIVHRKIYLYSAIRKNLHAFITQIGAISLNERYLDFCREMGELKLLNSTNLIKILNGDLSIDIRETQIWQHRKCISKPAIQAMIAHTQANYFFKMMDVLWNNPAINISALITHVSPIEDLQKIQMILDKMDVQDAFQLIVNDKLFDSKIGKLVLSHIEKFNNLNALYCFLKILVYATPKTQKLFMKDSEQLIIQANDEKYIRLYHFLHGNHAGLKFIDEIQEHANLMSFLIDYPEPQDVIDILKYILHAHHRDSKFKEACQKIIDCPNIHDVANFLNQNRMRIDCIDYSHLLIHEDIKAFSECLTLLQSRYPIQYAQLSSRLLTLKNLADFTRRLKEYPALMKYFYMIILFSNTDTRQIQHLIDDVWTDHFLKQCGTFDFYICYCPAQVFEYAAQSIKPLFFLKIIDEFSSMINTSLLQQIAKQPHLDKLKEFLDFWAPYNGAYFYKKYFFELFENDKIFFELPTIVSLLAKTIKLGQDLNHIEHHVQLFSEMLKNVEDIKTFEQNYDITLFDVFKILHDIPQDDGALFQKICNIPNGVTLCKILANSSLSQAHFREILTIFLSSAAY